MNELIRERVFHSVLESKFVFIYLGLVLSLSVFDHPWSISIIRCKSINYLMAKDHNNSCLTYGCFVGVTSLNSASLGKQKFQVK